MAQFRNVVETIVTGLLRKSGVPDNQLREKMKKTGRAMIIASVLMIVPLLVIDSLPLIVKILLQVSYAVLLCLGAMLAFEEKTHRDNSQS